MMSDKKDKEWEDDGRPVADMSGLERQRLLIPKMSSRERKSAKTQKVENPAEEPILTREERRWYILGVLKASLLIAGCFIVGLGVVIALLLLLWNR